MKALREFADLAEDGLIEVGESRTSLATADVCRPVWRDSRCRALAYVLQRLPVGSYQAIRDNKVWFFVPDIRVTGWAATIPPERRQVVYLSPDLEVKWDYHQLPAI